MKIDEYDSMIVLQVEYNKMTGDTLHKDVALAMVQELNKTIKEPRTEMSDAEESAWREE